MNTEVRGKFIRKVPNEMAKSKPQIHQQRVENNCHISYLEQAFLCRKWRIETSYIAS